MLHLLEHALEHAVLDTVKLIPFLFFTYLAMEYLEHKAGERVNGVIQRAGKLGPLAGALLGAVPQCGFSAAASGFYAGRVISLGTLFAIYLSTSDEMLPILISEKAPISFVAAVLVTKVMLGIVFGFAIDFFMHKHEHGGEHVHEDHVHELCEHEHCHCERGIVRSALTHTLHILLFLFVVTLLLELLFEALGEDVLSGLIYNRPIIAPILSAFVGLIPNCAASVVLTKLYLEGALSVGAMLAGLLTNAGVGVLVLFRLNQNKKESAKIVAALYLIGAICGIIISFIAG